MSYVDAGYTIVLATLAAYTAWLARRHRILSRALTPRDAKAVASQDQWR